jgi:hypothetical protein
MDSLDFAQVAEHTKLFFPLASARRLANDLHCAMEGESVRMFTISYVAEPGPQPTQYRG